MAGWLPPGAPGVPPPPSSALAALLAQQNHLGGPGGSHPRRGDHTAHGGHGVLDLSAARHLWAGAYTAPPGALTPDAQVNQKVALVLHFLLSQGHITPDVAVRAPWRWAHPGMCSTLEALPRVWTPDTARISPQLRALHYVTPFSLEATQLAALGVVAPPPRAPEAAAAPKPRPPPAPRAPRPPFPPPQPPASSKAPYLAALDTPAEEEPDAGAAGGEGQRPRRRKRARLDPEEYVTQHVGPGPVPGATNSAGTGPRGRLKWTAELKAAFDEAVESLGGLVHAQPAQILVTMRLANGGAPPSVVSTDGNTIVLSLNHLKSFLQKKRLMAIQEGTLDPADIGAGRGANHVRRTAKLTPRSEDGGGGGDGGEEDEGEGEDEDENGGAGGGFDPRHRGGAAGHKATNWAHPHGGPPGAAGGTAKAGNGRGAARPIPESAARLLALLAATGPGDAGPAGHVPHRFGPDEVVNGHPVRP